MSDVDLIDVLRQSSNEDLEPLVDILKKPMTETLSAQERYKKYRPDHGKYVQDIVHCIRLKGGNTIANVFRGVEGPEYEEIVQDVANKFKVDYKGGDPIEEIERKIVIKIFEKAGKQMNDKDREEIMEAFEKAGGSGVDWTAGFPIAAIIAQLGWVFLYRIMAPTALRVLGLAGGPVGWAITGLWTAISLAGPAYRITIPCVCHVAYLRQKIMRQSDFGGSR